MTHDEDSKRRLELAETAAAQEPEEAGSGSSSPSSASSLDGGRFAAGTLLGERYRVVGLLGRGGMGEVYLADDLRLGERVALKFLPPSLTRDEAALARLHAEVRTARRITHKNVVRVHDIGEADGQLFLSMEFVEGEDLRSLLRRIGRLPQDKAIELARQLAAGLAAAHERDILHRDLKPANVMIDADGQAKISDFGLARVAGEADGPALAGTPTYMAPEQLEKGEVSFASDIFSLGLVLYEMFCGRPAFEAESRAELLASHRKGSSVDLSSRVETIDPAVEQVVERCLARDPSGRPRSALDVAAALPGGDPVAAALAAGETPSPEMVAGARVEGALVPWVGLALFALLLASVAGTALFRDRTATANLLTLPKAPAVLEDRARDLAAELGHDLEGKIIYWGLRADLDTLDWVRREVPRRERPAATARPRPALAHFFFAATVEPVEAAFPRWFHFEGLGSGDLKMLLDPEGRLVELGSRPASRLAPAGEPAAAVDWAAVFAAAGLELSAFQPAEPRRLPDRFVDERRAWLGELPENPGVELRVEAAAFDGRLVELGLFPPWRDLGAEGATAASNMAPLWILLSVVIPAIVLVSVYLVRRNLKSGRGDRQGALRLSAAVFVVITVGGLLGTRPVGSPLGQLLRLFEELAENLLVAALFWLVYIALEPALRKRWPAGLVSWTRLLSGRLRDPLLGRDVLLGATVAATASLIAWGGDASAGSQLTDGDWLFAFEGFRGAAVAIFQSLVFVPLINAFQILFLFTLLLILLRRRWLAAAALLLMLLLQYFLLFRVSTAGDVAGVVAMALSVTLVVSRLGVTAMVVYWLVFFVVTPFPALSLDFSTWHAGLNVAAWAFLVGLGFYGYRVSTGGRSLFREPG